MLTVRVWRVFCFISAATFIVVPASGEDLYVCTEGTGAVFRLNVSTEVAAETVGQFPSLNRPIASIEMNAKERLWAFAGNEIGTLDLNTGEKGAVACDGVMSFQGESAISPDQNYLYATVLLDQTKFPDATGEWGMVFDAATLTPRLRLDPASAVTHRAAFSEDSSAILYWWHGSVWKKPISGGAAEAVGEAPGKTILGMGPSQDGPILVYTQSDNPVRVDTFRFSPEGCNLIGSVGKTPMYIQPLRYNEMQRLRFYDPGSRQIFCYDEASKMTAEYPARFSDVAPTRFLTTREDGAILLDGREFKEDSAVYTDQTMAPGTPHALFVFSRGYRYPGYIAAWDVENKTWSQAIRLEGGRGGAADGFGFAGDAAALS